MLQCLKQELSCVYKPYIEAVEGLYPNFKEELKLIEFKLIETLKLSLEFLLDWENVKSFNPDKQEYEFNDEMVLNNDQTLQLKGKIDRIDESSTAFSVIDYKSSVKNFSEKLFEAGLSLQLATYLWAYSKIDKKVIFAGYFSQKPERVDLTTKAGFNFEEEKQKKRQLKGITFDIDVDFDNASHINQWKNTEAKGLYTTNAYDEVLVLERLKEIYTQIYEDMSSGDIHKQNIDHSCEYCPYLHFCQYSGDEVKLKNITTKNSKLRKSQS